MSTEAFNLLITGSRKYKRLEFVHQVINGLVTYPERKKDVADLFVGDATGVDAKAEWSWADCTGKRAKVFKAQWLKYGKSAGPRRNREMITAFQEAGGGMVIAFWDGKSKGTLDCMKECMRRGLTVFLADSFIDHNKDLTRASLKLRIWQGEEDLT